MPARRTTQRVVAKEKKQGRDQKNCARGADPTAAATKETHRRKRIGRSQKTRNPKKGKA